MIQVNQKEIIRKLYFTKRQSVRQIARQLGHSRQTVRKAITDASVPQYRRTAVKPSPVMGPHAAVIGEWLETDKSRPVKQRHTAHRIYVRLMKEYGFTGGERTVREFVAKLRPTIAGMSIPLDFDPGAEAQCDWGEAQVVIAGRKVTANALCMKLSYSGKPFVMAFPTQRQEAFFEGQRRSFEWFEGTPGRIGYDNLTTAVRKVMRGRNREEQDAFIAFRSHYLFDSRFSMVATPREQGRVESLVGYMRRNYFVPVPEADSFEELNRMLLSRLLEDDSRPATGKDMTIGEAWQEEKAKLIPLPRFSHPCCISRPVKANHLSMVNFDGNRYSAPVEYGFKRLTLYAYAWHIEISCGNHIIATHERSYERGKDILEVDHYLPLLIQRPGAFPYARPIRQWKMPAVYKECYDTLSRNNGGYDVREFLQVLALGRVHGKEVLEKAIEKALSMQQVSARVIKQLITGEETPAPVPAWLGDLDRVRVVLPDLSQFDRLRDFRPEEETVVAAGGGQNV